MASSDSGSSENACNAMSRLAASYPTSRFPVFARASLSRRAG
ncbi:hypothetical protein C7S16_5062 [Burkholderia thailandensis]|uniref:Uncharacterized protein n=1 Tax=Burkholderia thailandensis TaxID=57975 RepID=A0AAW9CS09_BURTH|nr:hypothetical protein [Burkholderia thailandensis]